MFRKAKSVFRCVLASLYLSLLFSIRFINFSFPYYYYCYFPSSSLYHPCCHIYTLPQLLFHFHVCLQTNKLVNSLLYVFIKPDFLFCRRRLTTILQFLKLSLHNEKNVGGTNVLPNDTMS